MNKKSVLTLGFLVFFVGALVISQSIAQETTSHVGSAYKLGVIKGLLFSPVTLATAIRTSLANDVRAGTCGPAYYHGLLRLAIEGGRGFSEALSELADSDVFNGDDAEDELEELSDDIEGVMNNAEELLEEGAKHVLVLIALRDLATFFEDDVQDKLERIAREYSE